MLSRTSDKHYFSKNWGDGCMGRPPTSNFLGGPSPQSPQVAAHDTLSQTVTLSSTPPLERDALYGRPTICHQTRCCSSDFHKCVCRLQVYAKKNSVLTAFK